MLDRASPSSQDARTHGHARSEPRKPQLDALSPAACAALNGVYALGRLSRLRLGGRGIRITPSWQPQGGRVADPATIGLQIDDEPGELIAPEKLIDRALADLEPGLRLSALSDELRPILIEYALREGLDALEAALGCRISVQTVRPGRAPAADARLVAAHIIAELDDFGQASCLLRLAPAQLARLSAHLAGLAERGSARTDIPLPVRLRWARVELTRAELGSLKPGDIVLLDQTCRQPGIALAVIGEHLAAPVELLRSAYRLTGQPQRAARSGAAWALDRPPSNGGLHLADAGGPGDIPLTLFLEYGQFEIERRALAELRSGSELPLARPLEGGLDIVAGGVKIGLGEVTMIGDAPAVRITRLAR